MWTRVVVINDKSVYSTSQAFDNYRYWTTPYSEQTPIILLYS